MFNILLSTLVEMTFRQCSDDVNFGENKENNGLAQQTEIYSIHLHGMPTLRRSDAEIALHIWLVNVSMRFTYGDESVVQHFFQQDGIHLSVRGARTLVSAINQSLSIVKLRTHIPEQPYCHNADFRDGWQMDDYRLASWLPQRCTFIFHQAVNFHWSGLYTV